MKYTLGLLLVGAFAASAQAPATRPYGQARSELFRVHSSLSAEQQGDAAIVMAASYTCGQWSAQTTADLATASTILGTSITKEDCADVLLTIKSSKGSLVK
jgi:hypothetical protein